MILVEVKRADTVMSFPIEKDTNQIYQITSKNIPPDSKELRLNLPFLTAKAGDDGYYVVPAAKVCFLTNFISRDDQSYSCNECIMPLIGAKFRDKSYLLLIEGMKYDYTYHLSIENNKYSISLTYDLTKIDLYEDIKLRVITLTGKDSNYSGMARAYRKVVADRMGLVPLADRMANNDVLKYAATDMPVIRIRMAWKPVPTPVLEQSLETEPPMHVACTFEQVENLLDEMKAQGIEKAEICLVGWNVKGHDGRWPQVFPVEKQLGGEEGLRKLIDHAQELGYHITGHTNSSDAYRIAESWDENDIIKTKYGALSVNENAWSGGRMYNLCPKVAYEKYLQMNLPKVKDLGFRGLHYIDVLTIVPPRTCYDTQHPLTADESVGYLNQILQQTQKEIGGIASEGGYDFAASNLDFSLYIAYNLLSGAPSVADEIIPLWQLVYHGYILSNPSAETVNYVIKAPENRLRFYEFGGIPVLYFFSRFVGENGMKNWMGESDLFCATREQQKESVRHLKQMMDEYHAFSQRRLGFMEEHTKLANGVYETTYSDGFRTVVNYNETDFLYNGIVIPAKDLLQVQ